MQLWCWYSLHLHHREGEPAPDPGQCWARCGAHSVPGDGSAKGRGFGGASPSQAGGTCSDPRGWEQEQAGTAETGSLEIRGEQEVPGESRTGTGTPRFEQVGRDVAGAGMGLWHVGCTAKSSFRLLLWARCHGQAGRAEIRRSLGDAHVRAHTAACLSPGHCRARSREHLCSDGTRTQLHLDSALSMEEDPRWRSQCAGTAGAMDPLDSPRQGTAPCRHDRVSRCCCMCEALPSIPGMEWRGSHGVGWRGGLSMEQKGNHGVRWRGSHSMSGRSCFIGESAGVLP